MKLLGILLSLLVTVSTSGAAVLTVYTYDSLIGKGSLGEEIQKVFAKRFPQHKLDWVAFGSAGEALNQVAIEGNNTRADVVMGIDAGLLAKARSLGVFTRLSRKTYPSIYTEYFFDDRDEILPFDFGYLAVLYDESRTKVPSETKFFDLAVNPIFKKKLAIQDPRTSSLGLGFLIWANNVMQEKSEAFWNGLSQQTLTVAPGWSGTYGLFLKKEVDFVLSYTTSSAYHIEKENKESIKPIIFPDGHFRQIEGFGILRVSRNLQLAQSFASLVLGEDVQSKIPQTQWMYPVRLGTPLPPSFQKVPVPKPVKWDWDYFDKKRAIWLKQWENSFSGKK